MSSPHPDNDDTGTMLLAEQERMRSDGTLIDGAASGAILFNDGLRHLATDITATRVEADAAIEAMG